MQPLLLLSASALARKIREREVSAREVVEAHIAHVERVNPKLNALIFDRFEDARAEADRADARAQRGGDLPPLLGVPCTIKESFALEGMPNSGGLVSRKLLRSERDAPTVRRLRDAGAIPLGVTNLSELCMWMESNNCVYGRTKNPYDLERIAGGSSGGEGSIVGAGGAPFGLGSDIGGSIRMPAFFNGVFGHKPTGTLVPNTGQFPLSENDARRFLSAGPLARRAEDLMPLLRVLAGPDGEDPLTRAWPLGDPREVDVAGLEVVVVRDNGRLAVSEDLRSALDSAARALERRGARVVEERIDAFRHSLEIWSCMMGEAEETSFRARMGNGEPFSPGREIVRWVRGRSDHTLPAIGLAAIENVTKLDKARARKFVERGRALKTEIAARLGSRAVLLYPPYPNVAPRHNWPLLFPVKWMYTAIFNVLELPVTQVPLGLNAAGLPLGVQVAASHGNDHLTIAVAMELERAFGGWVPPKIAASA